MNRNRNRRPSIAFSHQQLRRKISLNSYSDEYNNTMINCNKFSHDGKLSSHYINTVLSYKYQPLLIIAICGTIQFINNVHYILKNQFIQSQKIETEQFDNFVFLTQDEPFLSSNLNNNNNTAYRIVFFIKTHNFSDKFSHLDAIFLNYPQLIIIQNDYLIINFNYFNKLRNNINNHGNNESDLLKHQTALLIVQSNCEKIDKVNDIKDQIKQNFSLVEIINLSTLTLIENEQIKQNIKQTSNNSRKNSLSTFNRIASTQKQKNKQLKQIVINLINNFLKKCWKYTCNISSPIYINFLKCLFEQYDRSNKNIIKTIKYFKKQFQGNYIQKINQIELPIEEFKLWYLVSKQKKQFMYQVKLNITSLPEQCEGIAELEQQFQQLIQKTQKHLYTQNQLLSDQENLRIVRKLYQTNILNPFKQHKYNSNNYTLIQKDFKLFMEDYSQQGLKTSTQLQIFNQFMHKNIQIYLEHIQVVLQNNTNHHHKEEQLFDKITIQTQVLKTLQIQVEGLQDKKIQIENKNKKIKQQIDNLKKNKKDNHLIHQKQLQIQNQDIQKNKNNYPKSKKNQLCCILI